MSAPVALLIALALRAQLGITVCSLGLGAVGESAVAHLLEPIFHAAHVPEGLLHPVAFAIALAGSERAALILGPPMMWIVRALHPVITALNAIANATVRLLGREPRDEVSSTFTRDEVAAMVEESRGKGAIAEDEYVRLSGALGFTERPVSSVLLDLGSLLLTIPEVSDQRPRAFRLRTHQGRTPHPASPRSPAGYRADPPLRHRPADEALRTALEKLQRQGTHMAQVVDHQDNLLGLVTLEDVLEELVGEIRDAAHHDE